MSRNPTHATLHQGAKQQGHSSPDSHGQPSLQGVVLLVVEDDPASKKLLNLMLTDIGASVTAVSSAEEALAFLETTRPALIVLDLILPRMGGLAFAEQVRADPKTRDIVILAVSALNGPEAERVAKAAGCVGYLRKPLDTATFAQVVATHLRGKS